EDHAPDEEQDPACPHGIPAHPLPEAAGREVGRRGLGRGFDDVLPSPECLLAGVEGPRSPVVVPLHLMPIRTERVNPPTDAGWVWGVESDAFRFGQEPGLRPFLSVDPAAIVGGRPFDNPAPHTV